MRVCITVVILTTVFISGFAAKGSAQLVSINRTKASLQIVIDDLRSQTGYGILIDKKLLQSAMLVTISKNEAALKEVLDELTSQLGLQYSLPEGAQVIVFERAPTSLHLNGLISAVSEVKGRIVDSVGTALVGASVRVLNAAGQRTTLQAKSDHDGYFLLHNVPENATLEITYIGYRRRQVAAAADIGTLILQALPSELQEVEVVVNTGYQQISRERFVGAVEQLDSAAYHRRVGMGILARLEGTVPGVAFNRKGPAQLQVRGISTLGNTPMDPLIIVDNFPYREGLQTINPNDVENVTVLKDAAAASIWGAQAGNGVIVITTKKGKAGQALKIDGASNVTVEEKPDLFFYPRISNAEVIDLETDLFRKGYYDQQLDNIYSRPVVSPVVEMLSRRRSGTISAADSAAFIQSLVGANYRNELDRYVYRPALSQQHYVNLSGGNAKMDYALSGGLNNARPNIQNSKGEVQYTLNSRVTVRPVSGLELEAGVNISSADNRNSPFSVPNLYPYARLRDESGNALAVPFFVRQGYLDTAGAGKLLDWQYRPLDEIRLADQSVKTRLQRVNLRAGYQLLPWLKVELLHQYSEQLVNVRNHSSVESHLARDLINKYTEIRGTTITRHIPLGGILDLDNTRQRSLNWRGSLSVNKAFLEHHQITAMVAGESSETVFGEATNRFYGFDSELSTYTTGLDYHSLIPTYGNLLGSSRIPQRSEVSDNGLTTRIVSVLANASYTYRGRYTLYGSARRDGANLFGVNTNNRWKPLWSVGAGWNLSDEAFYRLDWLPYAKLRVSYGYMGNMNNRLSGLPTISYAPAASQITNLRYAFRGGVSNPDLRWEEVETFNAGLDVGLVGSRVTASLDVFRKVSTDIIDDMPVDPSSGLSTYTLNASSLRAKGFEFAVNSRNFTGPFQWNSQLSVSNSEATVTDAFAALPYTVFYMNYGINPLAGSPAFGLYSFKWSGLDPANGDPQGYYNGEVSKSYVNILYDSVQNQVFHGSSIPLYNTFLKNTFAYKNLQLSLTISGRFAYYYRRPTINYSNLYSSGNGHVDYGLRWRQPGDEARTYVPSMSYPDDVYRSQFYEFAEVHVGRGDHIRIQDVQLQYSFSKSNQAWLPFRSASVFVYANQLNVFLWRADKSGYDPDFATLSGAPTEAPAPRTWAGGISINF